MKDGGLQSGSSRRTPGGRRRLRTFTPSSTTETERPLVGNKELQKHSHLLSLFSSLCPEFCPKVKGQRQGLLGDAGRGGGGGWGDSSCVFSHSVTGVLAPLEDMCSLLGHPLSSTHSLWLGPAPSASPSATLAPLPAAAARAKSPPEGRAFR